MPRLVYLIDDNTNALRMKQERLVDSGFGVLPFQYPLGALGTLADCPVDNKPYAVVADNETKGITGADVICFLRPRSVSDSLDPVVYRKVTRLYTDISRRKRIYVLADTGYAGKLVLTSRQVLKEHDMADWMSIAERDVIEKAKLNEALRIADKVFNISEDGSGIDELVKYLQE